MQHDSNHEMRFTVKAEIWSELNPFPQLTNFFKNFFLKGRV